MTKRELVEKIKEFECFRATPYRDAAGVLTIGYGRTTNVHSTDRTTKELENIWLETRISILYSQVSEYMKQYNLNENQKLALVDFCYNLGLGKLNQLTANRTRTKDVIAVKILLYCNAGGKKLSGLVNRRNWEYRLFTEKVTDINASFDRLDWEHSDFIFETDKQLIRISYDEFKKAYKQFQNELKG